MERHTLRPIPNLDDLPEPANKEERLKIIIANLEKQHEDVRSSILGEAREKLQSVVRDIIYSEERDVNITVDNSRLIANLNAPYVQGSGDPCATPGALLQPDPNVRQLPISPVLAIAHEAMLQLEAYDQHSEETRQYYVTALERMRGTYSEIRRPSEGVTDPRRRPTT